jgi:hypothetical protein
MEGSVKGRGSQARPRAARSTAPAYSTPSKVESLSGLAKSRCRDSPSCDLPSSELAGAGDRFIVDIERIVVTSLTTDATKLLVTSWTSAEGLRRWERD